MQIVNTSEPAVTHGRPRRRHVLHVDDCDKILGEVIFTVHESDYATALYRSEKLLATWCGPCLAEALFALPACGDGYRQA